ncbi:hypothetical protein FOL47_003132 [Perkinsus chesapeaki]|uniref:Uncharacterized protein n=1 Tax=Perkinsus chesapeaki TaxID=330153 RepID=A0A7J6KNK7_PERCH|nr:hypothetical protein FOL47_003132 [Perkinsus chesapeaki]
MDITLGTFVSTPDLAPTIVKVLARFKVTTVDVLKDVYEDVEARNTIGDECAKTFMSDSAVDEVLVSSPSTVAELSAASEQPEQQDSTSGEVPGANTTTATTVKKASVDYDKLEYQIIKARVIGALKRVAKSGRSDAQNDMEDTIQLVNSKALVTLGVIPSESVTLIPQLTEKIYKDPLGYYQLRSYREGETGRPKVVSGLNNESVWIKGLPKGVPIGTFEHWISAVCGWGVTVCIVLNENPVCVLEYASRVASLASQVGVAPALKYDNQYRMQLKANAHRLQAANTSLSLGKCFAECLRHNQSNDLMIQAYGSKEVRTNGNNSEGTNAVSRGQNSSVVVNRFTPGVCKYNRKDCPFPSCFGKGQQGGHWLRQAGDGKRSAQSLSPPVSSANSKVAKTN